MAFMAAAQTAKTIEEGNKKPLLKKKPLLLKKEEVVETPEVEVVETQEEETEVQISPLKNKKEIEVKVEEVKVEETETPEVEVEVEEPIEVKVEEVKTKKTSETKKEEPQESKEETTEEVKEEAPKAKRSRSKKAQKPKATETVEMTSTDMTYEEALEKIKSKFVDEEWLERKEYIDNKLSSISIPSDANTTTVRQVIEQLNDIKNEIWADSVDAEAVFENVCEVIDVYRTLNGSGGSNEQARKRSGVEACINYRTDSGEIVNLFEIRAEARSRHMFYKGAMMKIKSTQELLVGIQAMLKVERSVLGGEA